MAMEEDTESCNSAPVNSMPTHSRRQIQKVEVYNEVLRRLKDSDNEETSLPGFEDELWSHFNRLPTRYALDVNVEVAEDVLIHKRLLHMAHDPATRPVFEVRQVQVHPVSDGNFDDSVHSNTSVNVVSPRHDYPRRDSFHPPPAFGSAPHLESILKVNEFHAQDQGCPMNASQPIYRTMHEITISTNDRPKLLSKLTSLLSEIGLNIQEAHAFSTTDGYSLDIFVVDGWSKETQQLRDVLESEILKIENHPWSKSNSNPIALIRNQGQTEKTFVSCNHMDMDIPIKGTDVWELDGQLLKFEHKIASGLYGKLYKGTYFSQDVAIKVLNVDHLHEDMQKDFTQEIYILRKIRHKNVVQFIGACTRPPNLCIVTEYMPRGSLYDYLHKQKGTFKLPSLLKVAIDVSKGMNYLHKNKILHRDLKAANLLMDENEVVKVADFGVARVQDQSGVMTAETGTYRWMAPEVIEHKPYNHKADIFSFGVVLWELLTGKLPYDHLSPLQAAVGVVQQGLRPTIPTHTHPKLAELIERCWQHDPSLRPEFSELTEILLRLAKRVKGEKVGRRKKKSAKRILLALGRNGH